MKFYFLLKYFCNIHTNHELFFYNLNYILALSFLVVIFFSEKRYLLISLCISSKYKFLLDKEILLFLEYSLEISIISFSLNIQFLGISFFIAFFSLQTESTLAISFVSLFKLLITFIFFHASFALGSQSISLR